MSQDSSYGLWITSLTTFGQSLYIWHQLSLSKLVAMFHNFPYTATLSTPRPKVKSTSRPYSLANKWFLVCHVLPFLFHRIRSNIYRRLTRRISTSISEIIWPRESPIFARLPLKQDRLTANKEKIRNQVKKIESETKQAEDMLRRGSGPEIVHSRKKIEENLQHLVAEKPEIQVKGYKKGKSAAKQEPDKQWNWSRWHNRHRPCPVHRWRWRTRWGYRGTWGAVRGDDQEFQGRRVLQSPGPGCRGGHTSRRTRAREERSDRRQEERQ